MLTYLPMSCNTQVLYTEVLSNPTLVVADLPALASIAHARGSHLVVDNTFTPLAVTPARWGADVIVHSMTKFISGASDIIAGAVCGSNQFLQQLMDLHTGECGCNTLAYLLGLVYGRAYARTQ
jgi:methionine-gamma-lyase